MNNYDEEQLEQFRALGLTPLEIKVALEALRELTIKNAALRRELDNCKATTV